MQKNEENGSAYIVLTYRKQFIRKPYSEYKCCILSVKLNPQLFSCLLKLYHTTYPTSLNTILMRLTKKNVLSKMTSLQPHTALKWKKWEKWNCLISKKIAPLWHMGWVEQGPRAKGKHFFCSSSTYPVIILLVFYFMAQPWSKFHCECLRMAQFHCTPLAQLIHLDKMTWQGKILHDQIKYFIPLGKLFYPLR